MQLNALNEWIMLFELMVKSKLTKDIGEILIHHHLLLNELIKKHALEAILIQDLILLTEKQGIKDIYVLNER